MIKAPKSLVGAVVAVALAASSMALSTNADARPWHGGNWHGGHWHGGGCWNCGGGWYGPAIGLGAGLIVGSLLAAPHYYYAPAYYGPRYYAPRYYAPPYGSDYGCGYGQVWNHRDQICQAR
jgi:hypothetical protein